MAKSVSLRGARDERVNAEKSEGDGHEERATAVVLMVHDGARRKDAILPNFQSTINHNREMNLLNRSMRGSASDREIT